MYARTVVISIDMCEEVRTRERVECGSDQYIGRPMLCEEQTETERD
jgi:hypothetical protein